MAHVMGRLWVFNTIGSFDVESQRQTKLRLAGLVLGIKASLVPQYPFAAVQKIRETSGTALKEC